MSEPQSVDKMLHEAKEPPTREPGFSSFPERVWVTLSLINMTEHVKPKEIKNKETKKVMFTLDYIPWVAAWQQLMNCFPESEFEFDEPLYFGNGTGEQWVTLTVIDGDEKMTRRWWLPYMNHSNGPVADPTATQINNTRMRVLTKCIAMCGLGIEVYGGEDIPDERHDAKPTGVRAAVMEDLVFDDVVVAEWVGILKEIMPNKDGIDEGALVNAYEGFSRLGDTTVAVFNALESWQRTAIGKVRIEIHEAKRKEAVAKILDSDEPAEDGTA